MSFKVSPVALRKSSTPEVKELHLGVDGTQVLFTSTAARFSLDTRKADAIARQLITADHMFQQELEYDEEVFDKKKEPLFKNWTVRLSTDHKGTVLTFSPNAGAQDDIIYKLDRPNTLDLIRKIGKTSTYINERRQTALAAPAIDVTDVEEDAELVQQEEEETPRPRVVRPSETKVAEVKAKKKAKAAKKSAKVAKAANA